MVSIIIPIYNSESKLQRCLDSIITQSYRDWECILVDDGSTDDSRRIIDEYSKTDSRFISIHKSNGGVSSARNAGLKIAKGEWIVFVDSDDFLMPDHIFWMMEAVSDDVDIILTGYKKIERRQVVEHKYPVSCNIGLKSIGNFIQRTDFLEHQQPWDRAYRKKGNLRFDERLFLSEDRLYCYQYLMNCRGITTIDAVTYIHDVTDENSLSNRKGGSSMNEYRYRIYKKANKELKNKYCLSSTYTDTFFKGYMEGIYAYLINSYLNEGNKLMYHFTRILYRLKLK